MEPWTINKLQNEITLIWFNDKESRECGTPKRPSEIGKIVLENWCYFQGYILSDKRQRSHKDLVQIGKSELSMEIFIKKSQIFSLQFAKLSWFLVPCEILHVAFLIFRVWWILLSNVAFLEFLHKLQSSFLRFSRIFIPFQ